MNKLTSLIGLSLLMIVGRTLAAPVEQNPALSITSAGRSTAGKPLYDLKAEGADVIDVLKQIFAKAGIRNFEISPEIRQNVTISAKGATTDELLDKVRGATTPPFTLMTNGTTMFVTRSANAVSRAEEIRRRMEASQGSRYGPGIVPNGLSDPGPGGYRDFAALDNPVSLNVPDDKPITLSAALQILERQSRVPIRLDASVPADIKFAGVITRVPLRSVLQNIAPGTGEGSLKVVTSANQILIAPSDRYSVFWNNSAIGSTTGCPKCRQPLLGTWSFCPNCGQATKKGQLQAIQPGAGANIRKPNPLRPD